ncbi:MAG: NADH-quinone oxidoreductase subunit NuoH, partial [Gemmataceae bacterium]|nr:NADH-quinone oxidoreductase subunit NuoH [Gemmataceae bacterium]
GAFLVYVERKICAYMQNRFGPNRVGPKGLFQVIADAIKFLTKEETLPGYADKVMFLLAPCIALTTAMLSFAVIPFGATDDPATAEYRGAYQFVIAPGIDIGILFIFAVSSLAVYGIILGGWASNNKYSLLGGLRSSAQIISYEIPLGLSILGVVLFAGSLNLERIIWSQASAGFFGWYIFFQPLAFLLFMISSFAECNRLPFDLPETEQELVGGYHTEYNAWKLLFFFLGEYTHMVTTSFLMVILFLGGWHLPWIADTTSHWSLKLIVFAGKVTVFILFYMLVRWTIPRFRFDQLMALAWKVLIPLALVNLVLVMIVKELRLSLWWLLPASVAALVGAGLIAATPPPPVRRAGAPPEPQGT